MVETQEHIALGNRTLRFTLKRSARARALRMAVYPGGSLIVSAPTHVRATAIYPFIIQRSAWIWQAIEKLRGVSPLVVRGSKKEYAAYKAQALRLAQDRLVYFSSLYEYSYGKISIRNQKSRWGSCSKAGNLSFNYKIALLPAHLADYVIVHELCHTVHFNHGKAFWMDVAKTIPNPKACRTQLRSGKFGSAVL